MNMSIQAFTFAILLAISSSSWAYDSDGNSDSDASQMSSLFEQPADVIDRLDIELSGASSFANLYDLLTYDGFLVPPVEFLLNGRSTLALVDYLPTGIIEQIEIYHGGVAADHDSALTGSVVNIVLKKGGGGGDAQIGFEMPASDDAQATHASAVWGSETSEGHVTVGAGYYERQEIAFAGREYSKSKWSTGGAYGDARNISIGGNTFIDASNEYHAIGECDPAIYTGILTYKETQRVCGFPYGKYAWLTPKVDYATFFVEATEQLTDSTTLMLHAQLYDGSSFDRAAPAVDLVQATLPENVATEEVSLYHRFIANGNRENTNDLETYDIALELNGDFINDLEWRTKVQFSKSRTSETGTGYVIKSAALAAIADGTYDIINPLDTEPSVIEDISALITRDETTEHQQIQFSVSKSTALSQRGEVEWRAGVELSEDEYANLYDQNRMNLDVIGTSSQYSTGERKRESAFTTAKWLLDDKWEFGIAGRLTDNSDTHTTDSLQLTSRVHASDNLMFQAAISEFSTAPEFTQLNVLVETHPYVVDTTNCQTGSESACAPQQVKTNYIGNPDLKPSDTTRIDLGISGQIEPFSFGADVTSARMKNLATVNAQNTINLESEGNLPDLAVVERVGDAGTITKIITPYINNAESDYVALHWYVGTEREIGSATASIRLAGAKFLDRESRVDGNKQPERAPDERYSATLRAAKGNLSANWFIKVIPEFEDEATGAHHASWVGHDLTFQWRRAFGLENASISAGILNVTDEGPSLDPDYSYTAVATNLAPWYPIYGRTFFINAEILF